MSHLLVVDDSPTIRKLVELTFRTTSWTVDFAPSGAEGIRLASYNTPDVILLDFVLPDMRGLDVCAKLAGDARTRKVPIVLMSAKDESIKKLFSAYPSVVGFVPKPFTPEDLAARVRAAAPAAGPSARPASRFTHAQKESAAKALYTKLAKAFSYIPSWCAQMGAQNPAAFFARKILTPDAMGEVLEALTPVYREMFEEREAASARTSSDSALTGRVHGWAVSDLVTLFAASARTGSLRVRGAAVDLLVFWRCGEIVLVTSFDPDRHTRCEGGDVSSAPQEALAAAQAEQRASGKPVHVTLAERGALPSGCDLGQVLHRAGRALLVEALRAADVTFTWTDLAALPPYVDAFAKAVPVSRTALPTSLDEPSDAPPSSRSQDALDRARREASADTSRWSPPDAVLDRASGFSARLREVSLTARERRVLALIDGHTSLAEVATHAGLGVDYVRHIARCLADVGLVVPASEARARPVLLVDAGEGEFRRALESFLERRPEPVPVVGVAGDVVAAVLRERPRTVILDAAAPSLDLGDAARALRQRTDLGKVSLVAVLDLRAAARAPELQAAGFDAVLVKPVFYPELEPWIA
jgi:CheY-like chemotaxis protein